MRAAKPLRSFLRVLPAAVGLALLVLVTAAPARAITYTCTYTFEAITSNNSDNAAAGEAQLRLDVSGDPGSTTVTFTFYLDGALPMSITGIYFYDGDLGINAKTFSGFEFDPVWNKKDKTGVSFTVSKTPQPLPGTDLPQPSLVFSAVSTQPRSATGVNPGEILSLTFTLTKGYDIFSVAKALEGWLSDKTFNAGDLVVGLHVQAINGGISESFVLSKLAAVSPVPLPGTALLLGSGLAALGLLARRRRREPPDPPDPGPRHELC